MRKILIAGASGFIGHALIEQLLTDPQNEIVALSRALHESHDTRLTWKKCDLFSLKDITQAMVGCEEAYYLVHSMLPSAGLTQGAFYDFDLIMADNFIRAAMVHGLKHIIYLGGMIPPDEELSWHLRSRLEVETTFRNSGIKTTVLRAGLIIGPHGSSFTILQKLIERLPVMICPKWTKTLSQPVALADVITILSKCLTNQEVRGRTYDIGGPEIVTYQELISLTSQMIKKRPTVFTLNIIPLSMSRLWISLITGVSKDLVYPLVLSLKYKMLPSEMHQWPFPEDLKTPLKLALKSALEAKETPFYKTWRPPEKDVRSIQRLVLPPGKNAEWVALEYFNWLPFFFSSLVSVIVQENRCIFYLFNPSIQILILEKSEERSSPDRQLLYVVGGLLAGAMDRGRLEFREVLERRFVMAALHEFRPALPWYIYRWSQAIVHLLVMRAFGEHLKWHVIANK